LPRESREGSTRGRPDAAFARVPLPFFLKHEEKLRGVDVSLLILEDGIVERGVR